MIDDLTILFWGLKAMDFQIDSMERSIRIAKETYGYSPSLINDDEETLHILHENRGEFRLLIERWSNER